MIVKKVLQKLPKKSLEKQAEAEARAFSAAVDERIWAYNEEQELTIHFARGATKRRLQIEKEYNEFTLRIRALELTAWGQSEEAKTEIHRYHVENRKLMDMQLTQGRLDDIAKTTQAFGGMFSSIGNMANAFEMQALASFSRTMSAAASAAASIAAGARLISMGDPLSQLQGAFGVVGGVAQLISSFGSDEAKNRADQARAARSFGTTITRGPQIINITPTIIVEAGGDVIFSQDGIEVIKEEMINRVQQAIDDGELNTSGI